MRSIIIILPTVTIFFYFISLSGCNNLTDQTDRIKSANDILIRNILMKMSNGELDKTDEYLVELIKRGINEEADFFKNTKNNPRASSQAGARKAQSLVADVTAAYTRAIFKSKSPEEAHGVLKRFQNTILMIVEFTKQGKFSLQ